MKKILLTFMFVMVAMAASAFEQGDFQFVTTSDSTVTLNGFKSSYTGSSTTLIIPGYTYDASTQKYYRVTKVAWSAFNPNIMTSFATQLRAITRVEIRPGVEELDAAVFYNCSNLSQVFIPSSIKKMGGSVFGACPIVNINFAAEVMPTFVDNSTFNNMASVSGSRYFTCATPAGKTAADAVSHITSNFTVQWSHTAADFHSHVIGNSSEGTLCDVYLNVVTPVKASNPYAYYGKVKLLGANPRTSNTSKTLKFGYNQSLSLNDYGNYYVTAIDKSFRYRATDLKVLDLSQTSKMEEIEDYALYGCTGLTTANITAQKIGNYAFYNCTGLTSLTLSERVKTLGALSFAYTAMSTVTIPASLTSYGNGAFAFCGNLTQFNVASGSSYYATDTNTPNCLYNYSKTILYQMGAGTNPITVSSGRLSSAMPNTLTTFNAYAMAGNKMYTVDVPYGVKTVGPYAFSGMPNVQSIRIPSSVTTMYANTFYGVSATSFKNLYINLKTIPSNMQSSSSFSTLPSGVTLHVPLWRTGYYTGGSWWSGGWSSKFTGGVVEDAYDFTYDKAASGNYIDYILYYTVSSTTSYTDTKVQSTAVNGQLTVVNTYIGSAGHFNGTITFPNTTEHRGKTYITTEVQREVFRNQTSITCVTGGAGIKKIGALAFAGLTGCTQGFNIPNPVEFGDSSLFNCWTPTITLGDRLERIGNDAFRQSAVRQVLMPPSVTSIGSRFVAGDNQLDSLRLSPNITEIPYQGLAGVNALYIVLPYGVKTIKSYAFVSDEFSIGGGVIAEIGGSNIVVIPSSVTSIDPNAFSCARHLEQIFLNCPYGVLTTVKENWRRRMDLNASNAYDWSGHKLYVPVGQVQQYRNDPGIAAAWNENSDVGPGAFDFTGDNNFVTTEYRMTVVNPTLKTAKYVYCEGNSTYPILLSKSLTDHNSGIAYSMVEVGDSAFVKHTLATDVYLDDATSLTRIGAHAFRGLSNVKYEINVPASVTQIGALAFYGCTKLPSVFLNRDNYTSIGTSVFSTSQTTILYVPIKQFYSISNQTSSWLANTAANRRLLPYVKPTTEWSAISVPVSDNILLPASGEFYYAASLSSGNYSLNKTQLDNSQGIKGGEGMLMKGTVGTVYRFRRNDAVSSYSYVSPSTNLLKGVTGATSQTLTYSSSGPYYYTFDGQKFNRVNSSDTVYSGESYVQTTSSYSNVYINNDITTYSLYINGIQVTSENCSNLKVISGVSGTAVSYNPTTNTLTLNNATISTTSNVAVNNNISGLTIRVIGTNNLKVTTTNSIALQVMQNTTITGTGTLNAGSAVTSGCMVYTGKTLTVNGGVQVNFAGKIYGIYGYSTTSRMVISGANTKLSAVGVDNGSFYQLVTTMNDGLALTEPAGATWSNGTVMHNGSIVKNQEVVISKPTVTRGDVDGDGNVNISDVTALINYLLSGDASGVNISAADCDQDGNVNISDITTLINYLLSGSW